MNGRIIGNLGDEDSFSMAEREYLGKLRAIDVLGTARKVYVSHGAAGDWFVVEPQVGVLESVAGTPLTTEMAVDRLMESGRTMYELKPELWRNKKRRNRRMEHLEPAWRPVAYLVAGFVLGAIIRSIT